MKKSSLRMTRTACHIAAGKGVTAEVINDVFKNGVVSKNKVPGQFVVKKDNVSLIGVERDEDTFLVITMRATGKVAKR